MKFEVIPTNRFLKQVKRLLKKHNSLKEDLLNLETSLVDNPFQGTEIGSNVYKIRLNIKSKGSGKSGGARVITFVVTKEKEVYLMNIYDKSEISTIKDSEIKKLVKNIKDEFGIE